MPRYHLTCVPVGFYEGWKEGHREFEAPDDQTAINHSEDPAVPLRFIRPDGGGSVGSAPRKLIELTEPPRVIKEWS